jgi:protein-L-isoaspartate O-methyltransferase
LVVTLEVALLPTTEFHIQQLLLHILDSVAYVFVLCRVLDVGCGCGFIAACAAVMVSVCVAAAL